VQVERSLIEAVEVSKPPRQARFHRFSPHGVSGVVVIAESHFAIHTWPEYGYCALDIFTCMDQIDSDAALHFLKLRFRAESISIMEVKRGVLDLPPHQLRHLH
jgi:S-adenosylmethionine decarboxylase